LAFSQDATAASQQEQSAQSGQQQPTAGSAPAKQEEPLKQYEGRINRERTYDDFIREMGSADAYRQQMIAEGKEPWPPDPNERTYLGLGEEDYQALQIIVLDAYRRLMANEDEFFNARKNLDTSSVLSAKASYEKLDAIGEALGEKQGAVLEETMARLKQVLTEEGFKHADAYIYRHYGGGTVYRVGRYPTKHQHSSVAPAPEQLQPQGSQL
jgi:hypothetical protein